MCSFYNLKMSRLEFNAHFQATDDWRRDVEVTKDYSAPGKHGYVICEEAGPRVSSAMVWDFPFNGKPVASTATQLIAPEAQSSVP